MIKIHDDYVNQGVATDIIHLMNVIGNLHLHVSGEAKVDFLGGVGNTNGWASLVSTIISGDTGCVKPYDGNPKCALDAAIGYLRFMTPVPHLNSSEYEEFVPTKEEWEAFIVTIETEMKALKETEYKVKYSFEMVKDDKVIVTVTLKPLCNVFVVGEFQATRKYNYIGEVQDYDQPMTNAIVISCEGKDHTIKFEHLIYYRSRKHRFPRKGDYLLKDPDSENYVVLPQEDYSIH